MVNVFFSLVLFIEYTFIEICTYIWCILIFFNYPKGPGSSMSQVVGLPNNTAWVRAQLCKLQKGCTRLKTASDKVYQLLAHGRWFSHGTPASSTTKTGRHAIAEILLKVAIFNISYIKKKINSIKVIYYSIFVYLNGKIKWSSV